MLARFRAWGYEGVELALRDPAHLDVVALERALEPTRLPVSALATGTSFVVDGLSYMHPDDGVRRAAVQRIAEYCALARRIGGYVILGLIRGRLGPGVSRGQGAAWMREGVLAACEAGQRLGVNLLFEPINRYEADLVLTVDEGVALVDELAAPNLGLLLDTFHMNIEDADICASFRHAGPRVHHVHTADSNRCYPGAGHVDFPAVVATLREMGYRGYLSAEILPRPDLTTSLERAAESLRRLLGR
jgi:sugar phosphate isomerase/epimerase